MTTKLNLYAGPGAGFDQPFEMLLACHERVERMLCLLEKIAERLNASGFDQDCCGAAADVMRYFDLAGPAHHQDEEIHVLPLLKAGSANEQQLAKQIEREHLLMSEQWRVLREDLRSLCAIEEGAMDSVSLPQGWHQRWDEYARLYRAHIVIEESMIFGKVSGQLDSASLETIGQEMAQRRQSTRRTQ